MNVAIAFAFGVLAGVLACFSVGIAPIHEDDQ